MLIVFLMFMMTHIVEEPVALQGPAAYFSILRPPLTDTSYYVRINIPDRKLAVFVHDGWQWQLHREFPVGVGVIRHKTPTFNGAIHAKRVNPSWYAPRSRWAGRDAGRVISWNSRSNPFRAVNEDGVAEGYFLSVYPSIGMHTTYDPESVGTLASHGCIRMNLEDVRYLYRILPVGTPVESVYWLYRIEVGDGGLRVIPLEDVYSLYRNLDKRRDHLIHLLRQAGAPADFLQDDVVTGLLLGGSIQKAE